MLTASVAASAARKYVSEMSGTIEACHGKNLTTGSTGRGSHVAALRSLGLLHELQEHVANLQQTAAEQGKELSRLKGQKREAERMLRREPRCDTDQLIMQPFDRAGIVDLPPKLRALFEDNKVLKEEVRRYKCRAKEAEQLTATQQQLLARLQAQVERYKQQVAEGAASPEALAAEELARQQVDSAAKALQKLQEAHRILQQKLEADARSHKQALAAAAKERHQLEQQVIELQQQLDVKDKESRANVLAAKKAERRLHEVKAAAAEAVSGVAAAVAKAVAEEREQQKKVGDASVHLMLCILKEPHPAGAVLSSKSGQQQQQVRITSADDIHARQGNLLTTQSTTVVQHSDDGQGYAQQARYSREQAVQVIQAATRGFITRKQLKASRQHDEHAAVLIQVGPQGMRPVAQSTAPAGQQQPPFQLQELSLATHGADLLTAGTSLEVSSSNSKPQVATLESPSRAMSASRSVSRSIRSSGSGLLRRSAYAAANSSNGVAGAVTCTTAPEAEALTPVDSLPMELPGMSLPTHTVGGTAAVTTSAPGGVASAACAPQQAKSTARASKIRSRSAAPPTGSSLLQPSPLASRKSAVASPRLQATCSRSGSSGPSSTMGLSMRSIPQDQQQHRQAQRAASRQTAQQAQLGKSTSCRIR